MASQHMTRIAPVKEEWLRLGLSMSSLLSLSSVLLTDLNLSRAVRVRVCVRNSSRVEWSGVAWRGVEWSGGI